MPSPTPVSRWPHISLPKLHSLPVPLGGGACTKIKENPFTEVLHQRQAGPSGFLSYMWVEIKCKPLSPQVF